MSLTVIGNGAFTQIGQPRWIPGGLNELDALEIKYQGAYSELDDFRDSLVKWSASDVDDKMYLETFPDDGDGVKPTVTLRFIGCKGGELPSPQKQHGTSLATASQTDGELQLDVLYYSPNTAYTWIGENDDMTHSGFSNPLDISIDQRRVNGHIPLALRDPSWYKTNYQYALASDAQRARIDAYQASITTQLATAAARLKAFYDSSFSTAERVTEFSAVELVPGKYWLCKSVTSKVLEPI